MIERKCKICGKTFFPYPIHIYKDYKGIYCSWTCFNRKDGRTKYKRVDQYTLDGKLIKTYQSASQAAELCGITAEQIRRACRANKAYKGYLWRYKE